MGKESSRLPPEVFEMLKSVKKVSLSVEAEAEEIMRELEITPEEKISDMVPGGIVRALLRMNMQLSNCVSFLVDEVADARAIAEMRRKGEVDG